MKKVLIIVGAVLGVVYFLNNNRSDYSVLPRASATSEAQEQFVDLDELYDRRTTFQNMAEPGSYTVIEVFSKTCGRCKRLEADFPTLLRKRDDIVIKRVEVFSGRISFSSEAEADRWSNRFDAMMEFYRIRGTPHVEIYDSTGKPLAKDDMRKKTGTRLLTAILEANA